MSAIDFFTPEITEEVRGIVVDRILDGGNLANRDDLPRRTIKLALLLAHQLNNREKLTQQEEAILMGVTRDTLRKLKREKLA